MTCQECLDRLPGMVEEPDVATARHLRGCPACRRELARLRAALAALERDPAPDCGDLRPGIWARIEAEERLRAGTLLAARREASIGLGSWLLAMVALTGLALWYWRVPAVELPLRAWLAASTAWTTELLTGLWTGITGGLGLAWAESARLLDGTPAWLGSGWLVAAALAALVAVEWQARQARLPMALINGRA